MTRPRTERASATPLVVAVMAVAALFALGIGHGSSAVLEAERVSSAAELTALAEATGGVAAGDAVAAANGARVLGRRAVGEVVVVEVASGAARASAAARPLRR